LSAADAFWCELVLHGIGGATIEEAQERLTYAEAQTWSCYMAQYGTLNVGRRIDRRLEVGFAALAALIINRTGGHQGRAVRTSEFMDAAAVDEEQLTPEVFMRIARTGR
jgi:hypothetical protein